MSGDHKIDHVLPKIYASLALPEVRQPLDTEERLIMLIEQISRIKFLWYRTFQVESFKFANELAQRIQGLDIKTRDHKTPSLYILRQACVLLTRFSVTVQV